MNLSRQSLYGSQTRTCICLHTKTQSTKMEKNKKNVKYMQIISQATNKNWQYFDCSLYREYCNTILVGTLQSHQLLRVAHKCTERELSQTHGVTQESMSTDWSLISIQTQSLALHKRKPQALALANSQTWLPLLRPSIPIGWRLRLLPVAVFIYAMQAIVSEWKPGLSHFFSLLAQTRLGILANNTASNYG